MEIKVHFLWLTYWKATISPVTAIMLSAFGSHVRVTMVVLQQSEWRYRFCTNIIMSGSATVRMTIRVLYHHYDVWFCNSQNDDMGFAPTLWCLVLQQSGWRYGFCTNIMMSGSATVRMTIWVLYQHYDVWFCNSQDDDMGFVPTLWCLVLQQSGWRYGFCTNVMMSGSATVRMTIWVLYQRYDVWFCNSQNDDTGFVPTLRCLVLQHSEWRYRFCTNIMMSGSATFRMTI